MHISRKGSLFSRYASRIRRLSRLRTFARLWSRLGTETITTVSAAEWIVLFYDLPACSRLPVEVPAARPVPDSESGTQSPVPFPEQQIDLCSGFQPLFGRRVYRGVSKAVYFDGVDEADFLTGVPVLAFEADALFFVVLFLVVAAAVFGAGRRLAGLASCARM